MIFVNPDSRANRDIPNIGLALAATYYKAPVIDLNTMPEPRDRFLSEKTDILGVSVQSRTYSEALRIKETYKSKYPDSSVMSASGFLDVQCCYPYIAFQDDINPGVAFGDRMPFPDYDLFDSIGIFKKNWKSGCWRYAIITSLGCPFSCSYCSAGKRPINERGTEHCIEELRIAKAKWGITKFIILDDCFNAEKDRVINFCESVRPLNLRWGCANGLRADRFDSEVAESLHASGCDLISFGIESTDSGVLKGIKKGETIDQIECAIKVAKKYFSKVNGYFIIGLPGSDYGKDMNSLRWALMNKVNAHFSYYIPFDKQAHYDEIFYGSGAEPVSNEYPKELQKKLFEMTACMRADYGGGSLRKFLNKLFLVARLTPHNIPSLILSGMRSYLHV